MIAGFEVLDPGPLTTFQDVGRPNYAHLGVPISGAADRGAYLMVTATVKKSGSAVLETTLGGCTLRALDRQVVAVAGAPCEVFVGSIPAPWGRAFYLDVGQVLDVGPAHDGVHTYVAVAGGFMPEPVLGSRSTCMLTGIGPTPLRVGDVLPVGEKSSDDGTKVLGRWPARYPPTGGAEPHVPRGAADADGIVRLECESGPRADWFSRAALDTLANETYTVGVDANRIGMKLEGPVLERVRAGEMRSEGITTGAVQVPGSGQPLIFLRDHPATGGYPVLAVLTPGSVDRAAQLRPGAAVRFVCL